MLIRDWGDILLGENLFPLSVSPYPVINLVYSLDMFHTLHCVNALRMSLHKDHYPLTNLHGTHHLGKFLFPYPTLKQLLTVIY